MVTIHGLENVGGPRACILSVGNFDGVHLGHQRLIAEARRLGEGKLPVVVLTFEPHPLTVVAPARAPRSLCILEDKLKWLEELGVDVTAVAHSEPSLLGLEANQFVEDVLVRLFRPVQIVEGSSFGFGRDRLGNTQLLRQLGSRYGFGVVEVAPVTIESNGERVTVSSSLIRRLVADGKVERAAECLGRPHLVSGVVIRGQGRGRSLGFPTANLGNIPQLVPGEGVYAGQAEVGDRVHPAAISVGRTPTFSGQAELQVEAYLLDFDGDLYEQRLRLRFHRKLREQQRFEAPDRLVDQILKDVADVRQQFGQRKPVASDAADGSFAEITPWKQRA